LITQGAKTLELHYSRGMVITVAAAVIRQLRAVVVFSQRFQAGSLVILISISAIPRSTE
jgi:hypothetical protein